MAKPESESELEKELSLKVKKLLKECEDYAKSQGFRVNPNPQIAEGVARAILLREQAYGERYCPCRKLTNDKKADKKIICPCSYHKKEIANDGHCYCNLFVK